MGQKTKWFENDIELPLTASQVSLVQQWLPKYIEARRNHFGCPLLTNTLLKMGAPDCLDFLCFIEPSPENEFDLMGIRKAFKLQLSSIVGSDEHKEHYSQILNML